MAVGSLLVGVQPASALGVGAGPWAFGGDLVPQPATPNNGGPGLPPTVAEECTANPPPGTTVCGRGEIGGPDRLGQALLNSNDAGNPVFACPTSSTSHTAAAGTTTGVGGGAPPSLILMAGNFAGGDPNGPTNETGDTQCYNPYDVTNGHSAAAGGAVAPGNAYEAAPTNSCVGCVQSTFGMAAYIPATTPNGASGPACANRFLLAGGEGFSTADGIYDTSEFYDPHPADGAAFNTWTLGPRLQNAAAFTAANEQDSAATVVLNDGRVLMAGGFGTGFGSTAKYELFDPVTCRFEQTLAAASQMVSARTYFGSAKFNDANGRVLACGGSNPFGGTPLATCEVFDPTKGVLDPGGTGRRVGKWTAAGNLSVPRGSPQGSVLPTGNIVMAAGVKDAAFTDNLNSEECNSNFPGVPTCNLNSAGTYGGHIYASFTRIGTIAGSSAVHFKDLVLDCGSFGHGGVDTRTCEYYVAKGKTIPTGVGLKCNVPLGTTVGPAWCTSTASIGGHPKLDMNRERTFFALQEVPPCAACTTPNGPTGDTTWALGGTYSRDPANTNFFLTRKNVEYLTES